MIIESGIPLVSRDPYIMIRDSNNAHKEKITVSHIVCFHVESSGHYKSVLTLWSIEPFTHNEDAPWDKAQGCLHAPQHRTVLRSALN